MQLVGKMKNMRQTSTIEWFIDKYKEMATELVAEAFIKPIISEYVNKYGKQA